MLWKATPGSPLTSIRAFISSTFRDMAGERDVLARHVFPRLRQYSEMHGFPLSEIDLRWGITTEEAAEGRVIELCLREIDRCRPFFFCLLGDRYGWIDPHAAERLVQFPHLVPFADRSVTELEIRHGALGRETPPNDRCFFYFRDPKYLERLPSGSDPRDFVSETPAHRKRLDALKQEIRSVGLTVRDYADLDRFRDLIDTDLKAAIATVVDTVANGADEASQRAFATAHAVSHVESAITQSFLSRERGQRKPLVLVGDAGSGKSAALAHSLEMSHEPVAARPGLWQRLLRGSSAAARSPVVLCHFLQVDTNAEDWLPVVQALLVDLKGLLGLRKEVARTPEGAISQLGSWFASAATEHRLVVVIDGLDRAYPRSGRALLEWLPAQLPKGVDIILSTRHGAVAEALTERGCPTQTLPGLTGDEIKQLVRRYLDGFGKRLAPNLLGAIASAPQAANPLFARTVADELRQFGSHERLRHFLGEYLACNDVTALFARLLRRLDEDFDFGGAAVASDALALIAASRAGLAEGDILALLGTAVSPVPARHWAELRAAIDHHLIDRRGRVDIGPSALRDALVAARLPHEADWAHVRNRIVAHFATQEPSPHVMRELPWQLAALREWDRLAATIADPKHLVIGWRHCPRDLVAYWRELERRGHDVAAAHAPLLSAPLQDEEAARALSRLLVELGHRELARPLVAALVARGGDARVQLDALSLLAGTLVDEGDFANALPVLERLRAEARQAGDDAVLSICLGDLALCATRLGNPSGALAYHQEEEKMCRAAGDMTGLGECLGNFALDLLAAGQPREALARWREQEQIARRWNQHAMLCLSLRGQARALIALREGARAVKLLDEAAVLHREAGETRELRFCRMLTAEAHASTGDADGAFAIYQEIEVSAAAMDDAEGVAEARLGVARLFLALNRVAAAGRLAQQAEEVVSSLDDPAVRSRVFAATQAIMNQADRSST
jgi:hypothetical protein